MAEEQPNDSQLLDYARGTLELRKERNRKRTLTGEFVWSEAEDLIFALGLVTWNMDPAARGGTKRAFFLESFLADRGMRKTRKQIASRLQVLKGEWNGTRYSKLLRHPSDGPESPSQTPPVPDDTMSAGSSSNGSRSPTMDREEEGHSGVVPGIPNSTAMLPPEESPISCSAYEQPRRLNCLPELLPKAGVPADSRGIPIPQQFLDTSFQNMAYPSSHTYLSSGLDARRLQSTSEDQSSSHVYGASLRPAPYREAVFHQRDASLASGKAGFGTTRLGNNQVPLPRFEEFTISRESGLVLPAPRDFVGDYTALSSLSRVGLNEVQQVAMDRRQVHHSHGGFMTLERSPEELITSVEMPALPPRMVGTEIYGRSSNQPKSYQDLQYLSSPTYPSPY